MRPQSSNPSAVGTPARPGPSRAARLASTVLAALALVPLPLSGPAAAGDRITLDGAEFEVTRPYTRVEFHRVGAPERIRTHVPIPVEHRLAVAARVLPELERCLGLEARGERFLRDSASVLQPGQMAVRFQQACDDVFVQTGFAELLFDAGGRLFHVSARAETVPALPQPRWLSRGEALARAIRLAPVALDGKVLVNRRMFAVDQDTGERSAFHEVILGCRHRGTAEHWYVSFTPEGRVLHNDCLTIHE